MHTVDFHATAASTLCPLSYFSFVLYYGYSWDVLHCPEKMVKAHPEIAHTRGGIYDKYFRLYSNLRSPLLNI